MLKDPVDAESAVQETFLNVIRTPSMSHERESYLPWLYHIATNVCIETIRKRGYGITEPFNVLVDIDGPKHDPIREADTRRIFGKPDDNLDKRGQQLFVAHFIWGMDLRQMSDLFGMSGQAVLNKLGALRKKADRFFRKSSNAD